MKTRTLIIIGGIVVLLSLIPAAVLFLQNRALKGQLQEYAGDQAVTNRALTESLQRAETRIARANIELEAFAEEHDIDLERIREDLESIGGRLEAIAETESATETVIVTNRPSDHSSQTNQEVPTCEENGRPIDTHGYTRTVETRELLDSNGMRIADVSFSAAQESPWSSKVYGIRYRILNTIGRRDDGRLILTTELIAENPEAQPGETFRIDGVESRVLQAPQPAPQFRWWDPSLYLIAQLSLIVYKEIDFSASISLGFSVFSYGNAWRFLGVSAGYDAFQNTFRASLIPFLYNVGDPLPFLSDLWLFPDIGIDHNGSVSIGFAIGTRL
jgi:hypothetical protein